MSPARIILAVMVMATLSSTSEAKLRTDFWNYILQRAQLQYVLNDNNPSIYDPRLIANEDDMEKEYSDVSQSIARRTNIKRDFKQIDSPIGHGNEIRGESTRRCTIPANLTKPLQEMQCAFPDPKDKIPHYTCLVYRDHEVECQLYLLLYQKDNYFFCQPQITNWAQ